MENNFETIHLLSVTTTNSEWILYVKDKEIE